MVDLKYSVGQAARLGGVTARTLRYYERVGLLTPSERSSADYRLYSESDLGRLTRILYYRALGFSLGDIARMLGGDVDLGEHLARQHAMLTDRLDRLQEMITSLEKEMEAQMTGHQLTAEEMLEVFGQDYDPEWEDEARQRWGNSQAWRQSQERAGELTKADWQHVKADSDAWNADVLEAFASGAAPTSEQATDLAERHRRMVDTHFDCSYAMHRELADMYVADARYTDYFEQLSPGLARWLREAIHANAAKYPDQQGEGFC